MSDDKGAAANTAAPLLLIARALFAVQRLILREIPFMPTRFVWFRAAGSLPFPFLAAATAMMIGKPCRPDF